MTQKGGFSFGEVEPIYLFKFRKKGIKLMPKASTFAWK